jgi:hypothetical protein
MNMPTATFRSSGKAPKPELKLLKSDENCHFSTKLEIKATFLLICGTGFHA